MNKFKKGDRVENLSKYEYAKKDELGTVDEDNYFAPFILWDNGGRWSRSVDFLKLYEVAQTIVIYRKGRDTIATLKEGNKVIRTAKATCNPADTWSDEIGQRLAFDRLMGFDVKEIEAVDKPLTAKNLKVGDVVVAITDTWVSVGTKGIIRRVDNDHMPYSVDFEGSGLWWCFSKDIERCETDVPSFNWDDFKSGKFAVHCDTEEKAREFLKECGVQDIHWGNTRENVADNFLWGSDGDTCYYFSTFAGGLYQNSTDNYPNSIDYVPTKPIVKEVHRPAEVGEWIKTFETDDGYEKAHGIEHNHVYKVNKIGASGHPLISTNKENLCTVFKYVVLENYQPEEPKQLECFHCHSTTNVFMVEGIPICRVCSRKISIAHVEGEDVHTR